MTITNWILTGALAVTLGLLIITFILKKTLPRKICECLIIPLFGALNILLLRDYLPDSLHLIKITIFALSLVTLSTITGNASSMRIAFGLIRRSVRLCSSSME